MMMVKMVRINPHISDPAKPSSLNNLKEFLQFDKKIYFKSNLCSIALFRAKKPTRSHGDRGHLCLCSGRRFQLLYVDSADRPGRRTGECRGQRERQRQQLTSRRSKRSVLWEGPTSCSGVDRSCCSGSTRQ